MINRADPRIRQARSRILKGWEVQDLWAHLEKHAPGKLIRLEELLRLAGALLLDPEGWGEDCTGCGEGELRVCLMGHRYRVQKGERDLCPYCNQTKPEGM